MDEVVLRCRNDRSRTYIAEATSCYRAGAFRAAIVATWIAVAYDILDKLEELALTGDQQAEQDTERFERIRVSGDVTNALKFERDLIDLAKDRYELISPVEYVDLDRLREDRNRCAHPSMVAAGEVYSPPAELARLHLRNAVLYLLQRQPVQGKAAMDRLVAELNSPYFPQQANDAVKHFEHGPLVRPRDSLVRNFGMLILKTSLLSDQDVRQRFRYMAALEALRTMHRQITEQMLADRLPDILRRVTHDKLARVISFLKSVNDSWEYVPQDVRNTLSRYVATMPTGDIEHLETALMLPYLRAEAVRRSRSLNEVEIGEFLPWDLDPVLWDRAITIYLESKSFDAANKRVERVRAGADELSKEQIERLIRGAGTNVEVKHSFGLASLINKIRSASAAITSDELNQLLHDSGLESYLDELDESLEEDDSEPTE